MCTWWGTRCNMMTSVGLKTDQQCHPDKWLCASPSAHVPGGWAERGPTFQRAFVNKPAP